MWIEFQLISTWLWGFPPGTRVSSLIEYTQQLNFFGNYYLFNNCLAKWRLGAWDIQELPLLAASSLMENAPMAGKSRQPNHESHMEGEKTGTHHTDKTVERKGGRTWVPTLRKRWLKRQQKMLQRPVDQEHKESWRMCIDNNTADHGCHTCAPGC